MTKRNHRRDAAVALRRINVPKAMADELAFFVGQANTPEERGKMKKAMDAEFKRNHPDKWMEWL